MQASTDLGSLGTHERMIRSLRIRYPDAAIFTALRHQGLIADEAMKRQDWGERLGGRMTGRSCGGSRDHPTLPIRFDEYGTSHLNDSWTLPRRSPRRPCRSDATRSS